MTAKRALIFLFSLMALYGAIAGYFASVDANSPKPIEFLFTACSAVLIYVWYYFDAAEQRYKRSVLLGGSVVAFSLLAIPYYLIKSRPAGKKMKALLYFFGSVLLAVVLILVAGIPFSAINHGV